MQSSSVIFRKEAIGTDAMDQLRAEADVLKLVAHPNVVELVGRRFGAERGAIRLAAINGTPLAECELSPAELASVVLTTAVTVAYLHSVGVSHGAINEDHIMVRDDRHTSVLCGFSKATVDADSDLQAADVSALGTVLRDKLPKADDALRSRINGVAKPNSDLIMKLESLADLACSNSTSAAELAERLRIVVETGDTEPKTRVRISRWLAVAAIIPLGLLGFGVWLLTSSHNQANANTNTVRVTPCVGIAKDLAAIDTDGDGCPNAVGIYGSNITIDSEHYEVGKAGDRLVVGDWFGTGASTLALLRPATGELFAFDSWPSVGQTATPKLLSTFNGAVNVTSLRELHHDVFLLDTTQGNRIFDATKVQSH